MSPSVHGKLLFFGLSRTHVGVTPPAIFPVEYLLGAVVSGWIVAHNGELQHGEIQIGNATIGLTEQLPVVTEPAANRSYVWMLTSDVDALEAKMVPGRGFTVTVEPHNTPESRLMHAIDESGTTWIFQQDRQSR